MRRLLVVAAATLAAAGTLAATAIALENDVEKGCVDVVSGSFAYRVDSVVGGSVTVREEACKGGKYILFVLEESTDTEPLATAKGEITAAPNVVRIDTAPITTADTDVCVYVEARQGKNRDRAPDSGCVELIKEGSPGGGGSFN
jgi:hypothetical protein